MSAPTYTVLTTPYDTFPAFGSVNNTTYAIKSGMWSNPKCWSTGAVPGPADNAYIPPNETITIANNLAMCSSLLVDGTLQFSSVYSTQLTITNLVINTSGTLRIGNANAPLLSRYTCFIFFNDVPTDPVLDPLQYGTGLIVLGKVRIYGAVTTPFAQVAVEMMAGDTQIKLAKAVVGWQINDQIVVPDSHQKTDGEISSGAPYQWEETFVAAMSADNLTVTLTSPLAYNHPGGRDVAGVLHYLPHIANRNRNVMFGSLNPEGTRGHTMFTYLADVIIEHCGWCEMGRTTIAPYSSTNQRDRVPLQLRHLFGPATKPSNGYQFTITGCCVDDGSGVTVPNLHRWGIFVNDSHYGIIGNNLVYNCGGAGIGTQTGGESYNVFLNNGVARCNGDLTRVDSRFYQDVTDLGFDGSCFFFAGGNNSVTGNVGVNGATYGFSIYITPPTSLGSSLYNATAPIHQGADASQPGQSITIVPVATPIRLFSNNQAYGSPSGMAYWYVGATVSWIVPNMPTSTIEKLTIWNCCVNYGFYVYPCANLLLDNYTCLGANITQHGIGLWFSDYLTYGFMAKNANIQGMWTGTVLPSKVGDMLDSNSSSPPPVIIDGCTFCCPWAIYNNTQWANTGGMTSLTPRVVNILDTTFLPVPANLVSLDQQLDVQMVANAQIYCNFIVLDQLFVTNYNLTGLNYQVWYNEQAASTILPQTTSIQVGSPVAGLTNQENMDAYGICWAGEILPADAAPMARMGGQVTAF